MNEYATTTQQAGTPNETNSKATTAGYEIASVEAWVTDRVPGLQAPFRWRRLSGGHSNLTYRISSADNTHTAVIRRPPLGTLLPKAHDMSREWACISAMWNRIPVPEPLAFCADTSVTGAPFYVMGLVDGKAWHTVNDVDEVTHEHRLRAARIVD